MIQSLYIEKRADYFGEARMVIAELVPEHVTSVLEIGCGSGATIGWLRSIRRIEFAAGVELVPEAAARARPLLDTVIVGNVEALDLNFGPSAGFDLILVLDVLEHLVDPWSVIRRLHAVLAPGGSMIASIPNASHYSVAMPLLFQGRWNYAADGLLDRTHLRFFVERTAIDLIGCSGLVVDKVDRVRFSPRWVESWPSWALGRYLRWYFRKLLRCLPPLHLIDFQFLIRASSAPADRRAAADLLSKSFPLS